MNSELVAKNETRGNRIGVIHRKEDDCLSEVNSCDSGHDLSSLQDETHDSFENDKQQIDALQIKLEKAKSELKQKSVECEELQNIRNKVEAELEDLTTSLFEEANKMVYDANLKRHKVEKKLAAAEGKIEALQTEVDALKALVLTSTPSNPNVKSHPQLIKKTESSPIRSKFKSKMRQVAEEAKLKTDSSVRDSQEFKVYGGNSATQAVVKLSKAVDKSLFVELSDWHQAFLTSSTSNNNVSTSYCNCPVTKPSAEQLQLKDCEMVLSSPFMSRVFREDIALCLMFKNKELSEKVSHYIHCNSLSVELASGSDSSQTCSLSKITTHCKYRVRLGDSENWFSISQSCRNRITTVCDFLTYLRYIKQGIVKHNIEQIYWEIINLRMEMTFARLGYFREQT